MINRIIRFSVYHWATVLVLTIVVATIGWVSFQKLPIDAVPDITNIQVQINTNATGLAPEEIERNVTFPVEAAMSGIAGVEQVRSITRFGLSQVTVVFTEGTDIYRARQLAAERLQSLASSLPSNLKPKLGPITTGLGEIYHYSLEAEKIETGLARVKQLMELRALQEWFVKPRLLTVPGVAEVNTIGGFEKQFHIQPDPNKMIKYGIRFSDIVEALEKTNENVGGGYIQQTSEQLLVQGIGLLQSIEDITAVPIKSLETFKTVRIGDIAKVELAKELRTGAASVNGNEEVLGTTLMLLGENSRTVSLRVDERINEIRKALPPGFKIKTLYNRSELVNATIGTVEHNLLTGAGLVVIILLLLVGNVRAALITAVTIPLSLLITFVGMKNFGISGNLMSLGALDFGIIVDGAVIVIDNCVRVIHERSIAQGRKLSKAEIKNAVYDSSVEIRQAAGFGQLIIVVVFLPIFGLVGVEGKMFQPMAATFAIAIIGALILSFTTVPALASLLFSGEVKEKEPLLMKWASTIYSPLLEKGIKYKKLTAMVGLSAIALGAILFSRLGGEFLPQLSEGSIAIQFIRPVNISVDQAVKLQQKSEEIIKSFGEVSNVFSRIGTAEVATDPMGVNLSDTYVMLNSRDTWPKKGNGKARSNKELVNSIVEKLEAELPGQRQLVSQPIQMRFNELLEGTRADVSVKVYGDDLDKLVSMTREISEEISKIPGAGDVETELQGTSPLLQVKPKSEMLNKLGISSNDVLGTVGIAIGGKESGYLYQGVQRFPIIVRINENLRSDLDVIKSLPVGISANTSLPLSSVANIKVVQAYGAINREQSKRRAAVLINLRGRDTENFVKEAKKIVDSKFKLPTGYFLEWGGNFKNLEQAKNRLLLLTPIALGLVLIMIYTAFGSIFQTALVFSGVPLALVGGVLGLTFNGLPFSISAGVGFIALSGIAVLNGIVLVHYFNDLQKEGMSGEALVRKGTKIRLRPVLMTALVDVFGFVPMMLSSGVGAEVQKPLAAVVIGGIISSTILTLIVLPSLYLLFEKKMAVSTKSELEN